MKVLLISPYHGGSHRAWAEGYSKYSRHDIRLLTLPARYWKWRMHGGALTLAREFLRSGSRPDLILATDMLDLSTFVALTRERICGIGAVLYMHENQLTYPLPRDAERGPMRRQRGERDLHYAFINLASMLSARRVIFNSEYHRRALFEELPRYLRQFPEYPELESIELLRQRSSVLPVGLDLEELKAAKCAPAREVPLLLWNQRWEYDKNPGLFFEVLLSLAEEGLPFEVALCGQSFQRQPEEFAPAIDRLGDRVIHCGFAPRPEYRRLLWKATLTFSTAHHEFFGISILEAMACETFAVLPRRLSYPEILPGRFHDRCLYGSAGELRERLIWALAHREEAADLARELALQLRAFDWKNWAPSYDRLLEATEAQKSAEGRAPTPQPDRA